MKTERLKELYLRYELTKDDVFKHPHYVIIPRSGIDKLQAKEAYRKAYEAGDADAMYEAQQTISKIALESLSDPLNSVTDKPWLAAFL